MRCKNPRCHYNLDPSFVFCPKCALRIDNKDITEPNSHVPDGAEEFKVIQKIPLTEQSGLMRDEDWSKIRSNIVYLMEELDPNDLITLLYSKYVLSEEDVEKLEAESNKRKRARDMLMKVHSRGFHAYKKFLKCLEIKGYWQAIKRLEPESVKYKSHIKYPGQTYLELIDVFNPLRKEFIDEVETNIEGLYKESTELVVVKQLSKGCVQVTFSLISLDSNKSESELRQILETAINSGFIGGKKVSSEGFSFEKVEEGDEHISTMEQQNELWNLQNELRNLKRKLKIVEEENSNLRKRVRELLDECKKSNKRLEEVENDSSQTFLLEKHENQTLLKEHNKKKPSDQETDVTNPQPQIAEVENSKQTEDIRSDLKTATVSQLQIAEVEKLRHTVNIQNVDFVKLCNLLLQDGYLNEKDKEAIVSSESAINTMDTLMDMLTKTNNSRAYTIVIKHLKSGTSMETTSSTQGDAVDARPVSTNDDSTDAKGFSSRPSGGRAAPAHNEEPMQWEENFYTEEYKMDHPKRGKAIIINNKTFERYTQMGVRTGTDKDKNALEMRFNELGFKVVTYLDLPKAQMETVLKDAASENHGDSDCFMCAILSHGEEGTIYGTDGPIEIKTLLAPFKGDKCRSLAGKPKIFFIQACRGTGLDRGLERTDALPEVREINILRIPTEADFLIAYSVVPGYFSWRNSVQGSWFVQAISEVFKKYGTELDLMTLMTRVNKKVAYDFESNASQEFMNRKKQIPCITSMLTKDVYFRPKPL